MTDIKKYIKTFFFLFKRAGRHFGFFKRAGRHEKGAGRHEKGAGRRALQKKPRQNTVIRIISARFVSGFPCIMKFTLRAWHILWYSSDSCSARSHIFSSSHSLGLYRVMMKMWKLSPTVYIYVCDCGERQTMSHVMTCGDAPNSTPTDLAIATLGSVNCAKHWGESI